ncbi:Adenosine deaminase, alternative form [Dissulfuribacter thermophilus]|uniref:Adenosine deaminase, alternative form n=1 Tax=Dissulfuribacter thermophilus TaxID=1156395 RepID=A0A1B9F791_9BACT|nr:amidohydrolase family protein [Dissulfuribacter thermophilus]OCC15753.1 Adenosine deaminase, alternative form [Dissulfuribacter thermophilus]
MKTTPVVLHSAPWIIPISQKPIRDGAVAIFEGKIIDVGPAKDLRIRFPGHKEVPHPEAVLMPALVNAHCHLELSPLKWRLTPSGSFSAWINALIKARENISPEEWIPAIEKAIDELVSGGAIIIGDVGNTGLVPSMMHEAQNNWPVRGIHFLEIIQPEEATGEQNPQFNIDFHKEAESIFAVNCPMPVTLSAHAVHTVEEKTLMEIKHRNNLSGLPFTLHVAESPEEMEYLQNGSGPMIDLLKSRGRDLKRLRIPGKGPISYLHELGLLDKNSLLVHCVHVTDGDLDVIQATGANVCLCPRSNTFLGVGTPPASKMFEKGINCALGTDSLASNDKLDLFAEMTALSRLAPNCPPSQIIRTATLGGAMALGLESQFGSIESGKNSPILALSGSNIPSSPQEVEESIIWGGSKEAFEIEVLW